MTVQAGRRYELAIVRSGHVTLHDYYEPFVRSDYTLRLLASDSLDALTGNRPGSMRIANVRYKEFWGDVPHQTDQLRINGTGVCTATLCPGKKHVNLFFAYDATATERLT